MHELTFERKDDVDKRALALAIKIIRGDTEFTPDEQRSCAFPATTTALLILLNDSFLQKFVECYAYTPSTKQFPPMGVLIIITGEKNGVSVAQRSNTNTMAKMLLCIQLRIQASLYTYSYRQCVSYQLSILLCIYVYMLGCCLIGTTSCNVYLYQYLTSVCCCISLNVYSLNKARQ